MTKCALTPCLVGLALLGLWMTPQRINHDCALYLQQAEMLLDGAVPYCDFVDSNPPLVVYLNVLPVILARTLGVSVILAFQGLVVALLALSALEIHFLLGRPRMGLAPAGRGLVLLMWMALYFIVDLHGDTGQREHLFVMLYVPFLFLRILRHRGGSVAGWLATMLGVQAGIGVSLKPHFLLAAIGVEIVLMLSSRRGKQSGWALGIGDWRSTVLQPENFALGAVVTAYVAHWLLVPAAMREAFFCRWLPLVRRGYYAYNLPYREVAETILGSPISLAALAGALLAALRATRRRTRLRHHLAALAALAGMALAVVFLQQKGWSYHRIPLDAAGLLCLAVLAAGGERQGARDWGLGIRNWWGRHAYLPTIRCPLFTIHYPLSTIHSVFLISLGILLVVWFTGRGDARPDPPTFDALRRTVEQQTRPGDRVLVICTSARPAYPMLLQMGRKPGSRYLCSFPLAFFYAGMESAKAPVYRRRGEAPPEERQFLDELQDDVARLRPRLIVIQNESGSLGLFRGFNTFEYLVHSGWTEAALTAYREVPGPKGWKVFALQ